MTPPRRSHERCCCRSTGPPRSFALALTLLLTQALVPLHPCAGDAHDDHGGGLDGLLLTQALVPPPPCVGDGDAQVDLDGLGDQGGRDGQDQDRYPAAPSCTASSARAGSPAGANMAAAAPTSARLPTFFLCHGGGPMPLLGDPGHSDLVRDLRALKGRIGAERRVRAILVVSAHWEASPKVRVTSSKAPTMLFDYSGEC